MCICILYEAPSLSYRIPIDSTTDERHGQNAVVRLQREKNGVRGTNRSIHMF